MNSRVVYDIILFALVIFDVFICIYYFNIFLQPKKINLVFKISTFGILFLGQVGIYSKSSPYEVFVRMITSILMYLLIAVLVYDGSFFVKLFCSLLYMGLGVISEVVVIIILSYMNKGYVLEVSSNTLLMLQGNVLSKLSLLLLVSLVGKFKKSPYRKISKVNATVLVIIPVFSILIVYKLFDDTAKAEGGEMLLLSIVSTLGMLAINVIIFFLFEQLMMQSETYLKLKLAEQQLLTQANHYEQLMKNRQAILQMLHDEKNHLISIDSLAASGDCEMIREYIQKLDVTKMSVSKTFYSGHPVVDAVIDEKRNLAKSTGIDMDIKLHLPKHIGMENVDLCIVLGNALDNAIEACNRMEEAELPKSIKLIMSISNKHLIISITNPCDTEIDVSTLTTSKPNKEMHGFGLQNIKMTVEKYNGNTQIAFKNKTFILNIIIPIK